MRAIADVLRTSEEFVGIALVGKVPLAHTLAETRATQIGQPIASPWFKLMEEIVATVYQSR